MSNNENKKDRIPEKTAEPIWWLLFGLSGTVTAIFLPAVILIIGFGLSSPEAIQWLFLNSFGRFLIKLFAVIVLWGIIHRIRLMLHDFKIHLKFDVQIFYGIAILLTILLILS